MFNFLSKIFGLGNRGRKYNFRKIDRLLGKWSPHEGYDCIKGTTLPKFIELPESVSKFGDEPGKSSFSRALFPYWLRVDPSLAGFLASRVSKGELYEIYEIKREGKKPRIIASPCRILKFVQRRILQRILEQIEINDAANGFVKGRSIFTSAAPHVGKRVVVTLDMRDFFDTITYRRVAGMFMAYGIKKKQALLLAALCCKDGKLPQGAPTSPAISNIICRKLDSRMSGLCKKKGFDYSRYADDMIFSGSEKLIGLIPFIKRIISEEGFEVADEKTCIKRSGSRQKVLGLNVNSKVSVPRRVRRMIRAMVDHQVKADSRDEEMVSFLEGHISFMAAAHPEEAEKLKNKLTLCK